MPPYTPGMKPNPLSSALLVLLAVAIQLPAQQPATNATGTKPYDNLPRSSLSKPGASDSVPTNAFGFVPLPEQPGTTNAGSVPGLTNQTVTDKLGPLKTLANSGEVVAQDILGQAYQYGWDGLATNFAEAVSYYRKAADSGYRDAQDHLGDMYKNGEGVPQNHEEAMKWWRKAAEQGDADAQYSLGEAYLDDASAAYIKGLGGAARPGVDVPDTNATAAANESLKWLRKAAEQGNLAAQTRLGVFLSFGGAPFMIPAISKNPSEAAKWYLRAAAQGDASSQSSIAGMYEKGEGVVKDFAEAVKWYRKAAEQGDYPGQFGLGTMYLTGEGVAQNYVEAYKWYNIAAASSSDPLSDPLGVTEKEIAEQRDRLAHQMTAQQIAEGQRLSAAFVPRTGKPGSSSQRSDLSEIPTATGTGFFITDDGYLISNYHVVKEAVKVRLLTGAGLIDARVVKVDAANDLALLKTAGRFAPLPVAASRGLKLGGTVATVGFPDTGLQGFSPKLAKGEIASLAGSQDDARYFQISVPVQPGNSGGALVDARGNVVGIVAAKLSARAALEATGALPENVNYAVKSSFLLGFLESVPDVSAKLKEPDLADLNMWSPRSTFALAEPPASIRPFVSPSSFQLQARSQITSSVGLGGLTTGFLGSRIGPSSCCANACKAANARTAAKVHPGNLLLRVL